MREPRPPQRIKKKKKWGWGGREGLNPPNPNFTAKAPTRVTTSTLGGPPQRERGEATAHSASSRVYPEPPAALGARPRPGPAAIHARKRTPKGKSDTSVSHRAKHWKHEIADVDQDHPGSSRGGGGGGGCARALCGAAPGRGRWRRRGCGSRRGGRRSAGRGRRWGGGWRGDRWPMERLPSRPLSTFKGAGAAAAATQRRAQPMGAERSAARPRRNRGGQRGPRARGWWGEGGVTAEKEPAANRGGPRPGAGRGSALPGAWSPARVPGRPQAGARARGAPCTQTQATCTWNVHTPRGTCTQTC